jgi:aromatic ring-opening dioxygenase catalytic subunit (LigB family)
VAEVVGGFGVPHNPHFPTLVEQDTPLGVEVERLYGSVADRLWATTPDVILFITSDHYNIFWETLPIFSIGVAESAQGASDYPSLVPRELRIDSALAHALQAHAVQADFDVGVLQEFDFDHTVVAPMNFLAGERDVPLVPVFVNAFLRPLPSARRCFALGRALREAVERYPTPARVAVVASGSFSLEIGGPRIAEDSHVGVPDSDWYDRVVHLLGTGEVDRLVEEATDARIEEAGNAAGEILDWIVMLGTIDAAPAAFLGEQPAFGHAFAAWPGKPST